MALREKVWQRLASDMRPRHLAEVTRTVALDELPKVFDDFIDAKIKGRVVVDVAG
jgi:hypothetical protein